MLGLVLHLCWPALDFVVASAAAKRPVVRDGDLAVGNPRDVDTVVPGHSASTIRASSISVGFIFALAGYPPICCHFVARLDRCFSERSVPSSKRVFHTIGMVAARAHTSPVCVCHEVG